MQGRQSWIIVRRVTGEAAFETFNPKVLANVDPAKAYVMTAHDWLCALNRAIAMNGGTNA